MSSDPETKSRLRPMVILLALFLGAVLTGSVALAGLPTAAPAQDSQSGSTLVLSGHVSPVGQDTGQKATLSPVTDLVVHDIDMGALGIRPYEEKPPEYDTGAIGIGNAYMVASPDVVSQSTASALGTLLSGFTPAENVDYYLNGTLAGTFAANANGVVAVGITTGAGLGYITFEGRGQTSLKRAGTVAQVLDNAPYVPGFAHAPHAINTTAGASFYAYGFRWIPNSPTAVTLYRNGVSLGSAATSAAGRFFTLITPANNGDTSAIYTAISTTVPSMSGSSVEERADAGTPPSGDMNLARVFVDRPVYSSTLGASIGFVGEGFQPGETVTISGCASGSAPADSNGALGATVTFPPGAGVAQCIFTGGTSGRVGRGSVEGNVNAKNAPSAINVPSNISTTATSFAILFNRLLPNQSGTIYIDGVAGPAASTNASGYGSALLTSPGTLGLHEVAFIGSSGQVAIAPLWIVAPSGATSTPTSVPATATNTTVAASATATVCVPGAPIQETEPNNTIALANPIGTNGAEVRGGITPAGDLDYFSFSANAGDRIWTYINTSNAAPSTDSILTLFNAVSTTIQLDDDNGFQSTLSSAIAGGVITQTGTHAIQVRQFGGATIMSPYSLYVDKTTSSTVPEIEPNDVITQANAYSFGTVVTGSIPISTDLDYYTFPLAQNERVVIQVDGDPDRNGTNLSRVNQFNPNFDLLAADGSLITAVDSDSQGGNGGLLSEALVFTNTSAISTTFAIRIKFDPSTPVEDDLGIYNLHMFKLGGGACGPTGTPTNTVVVPTATATNTAGAATATPTICTTNYTYTASAGATIVPGTVDIGNHGDDVITSVTLPFPYTVYDLSFTTVNVSSNGNLQFNSAITGLNDYINACLPVTDRAYSYTIYAFWDDQITAPAGKGVFSSVSGVAPNRIFNLEFRTCGFSTATTCAAGTDTNYEVRLYEGQTRFDLIYAVMGLTGSSATTGIQKNTTTYSQNTCNTAIPAGTMVMGVLGACATPTPGGATATATPTGQVVTATPTSCAGGPLVFNGAIAAGDPTQTNRLFRDDPQSTCAVPQTCAQSTGTFRYDTYTLTNSSASAVCVSITLDPQSCTGTSYIQSVAYLGTFNPASICANYLGDIGVSPEVGAPRTYEVTVPAGATFVIVVNELFTAGCPAYTLTVSGLPSGGGCPTPTAGTPVATATTAQATPTCPAGGPTVFTGSIDGSEPTHNSVLGAVSSCGSTTPCPGELAGTFHYDTYQLVNNTGSAVCVTVDLSDAACVYSEVYSAVPDPGNACTAYVADSNLGASYQSDNPGEHHILLSGGRVHRERRVSIVHSHGNRLAWWWWRVCHTRTEQHSRIDSTTDSHSLPAHSPNQATRSGSWRREGHSQRRQARDRLRQAESWLLYS